MLGLQGPLGASTTNISVTECMECGGNRGRRRFNIGRAGWNEPKRRRRSALPAHSKSLKNKRCHVVGHGAINRQPRWGWFNFHELVQGILERIHDAYVS